MTDDVVDLLRRHDPVASLDPIAPPELLERVCAEPRRPARPPRFARRRVGSALSVAAVAAALLVISAGREGHFSLALAARAYAQTDSAAVILHVIYRQSASLPTPSPASPVMVIESWLYRNQAPQIVRTLDATGHPSGFSEQILGADGVLRNYVPSGGVQTLSPADGPGARLLIDSIRTGFVATFRAGYQRGTLDDTGTTTFMGRPRASLHRRRTPRRRSRGLLPRPRDRLSTRVDHYRAVLLPRGPQPQRPPTRTIANTRRHEHSDPTR